MTTHTDHLPRRCQGRACAVLVTLTLALAGCTDGRPAPARGSLPPHERSSVHAGVDELPPDAKLSIDATKATGLLEPGKARAQRIAYRHETGLALSLLKRYVTNPYRKGRFTVGGDVGPSATTLGRAAAAVSSAVAALDTALPKAPLTMAPPTMQLRTELLTLGGALRHGDTVSAAGFSRMQRLTSALIATGATAHLRLHAGRAPVMTPVVVVPQWRIRVRREINRARQLTNNGLGALRRYVVIPAERGKFSPTVSAGERQHVQHRAQEALAYALGQWAQAINVYAGHSRLRPLAVKLAAMRRLLTADASAARAGTLSARQAANVHLVIDEVTLAGRMLRLRLRAGRSPTFAT